MPASRFNRAALLTLTLLLSAARAASALELQVMTGTTLFDWAPLPQVEAGLLTSPTPSGFQQQIGLRFRSLVLMFNTLETLARSRFSFPTRGSDFLREKLRVGLEYPPNNFAYMPMDWPPNYFTYLELAACSSLMFREAPHAHSCEISISSRAGVARKTCAWDSPLHRFPIWPSLNLLNRRQNL
jgi:hypothetical protein